MRYLAVLNLKVLIRVVREVYRLTIRKLADGTLAGFVQNAYRVGVVKPQQLFNTEKERHFCSELRNFWR